MTLLLSLFGDQVWFKEMCMDAKLTGGGLVRFMRHGVPRYLVEHYSNCALKVSG